MNMHRNANRKAAILAGVLYFLGIIAGLLSVVPVIDTSDYLVQIAANAGQVTRGAFFQFLMTRQLIWAWRLCSIPS